MSSRKKGGTKKTAKPTLIFDGKEVPAGSALYSIFESLTGLDERRLAGAAAVIELTAALSGSAERLRQMQSQIDRIETKIAEHLKAPAEKHAEPAKPAARTAKKPAKKPAGAAKTAAASELAELEETVEQRQARMARMEKEEKRKEFAFKERLRAKKDKEAAVKPSKAADSGKSEKPGQKKKTTRKRKTAKKAQAE